MFSSKISFVDHVKGQHPEKLQIHEELLRELDESKSIKAIFDGSGDERATYHIRLASPPTVRLVDVYADGSVYVCWKPIGNEFGVEERNQLKDLFDVINTSNDDGSFMRNDEGRTSYSAVIRVAQKLDELDKFAASLEYLNPDEQIGRTAFIEGGKKIITVNSYERDRRARDECIKHHGHSCAACRMTFFDRYGVLEGFIHVHHKKQVSASKGTEYVLDPKEDLVPLCPNCHAVAHARPELYSIEEIRELLRRHSK